jgi:hypothetical protein
VHLPIHQETKQIGLQLTVGHWVTDQNQPMVYFRSDADFKNVSLDQAQLATLNNSYIWDKNYLKQKNASERISLNLINSTAKNLLQKTVNEQLFSNQNSFLKYFKSLLLSSENVLQLFLE